MDVDGAFRSTGGAGSVDEHVRGLGVALDWLGRRRFAGGSGRVPPPIAVLKPGRVERLAGTADDEDVLDRWRGLDCRIGHRLEVHPRAAAEEAVSGDEEPGAAIDQARSDGRRRIAREDRREDRPDAADREDRDDRLGQHRHQDPDAVALADPELAQLGLSGPDGAAEAGVGHLADGAVLAFPGDRDALGIALGAWLDGGPRPVERSTDPPADPCRTAGEVGDLARTPCPGDRDVVGRGAPEPGGIIDCPPLQRFEIRLAGRAEEPRQPRFGRSRRVGPPRDISRVAPEDRPGVGFARHAGSVIGRAGAEPRPWNMTCYDRRLGGLVTSRMEHVM